MKKSEIDEKVIQLQRYLGKNLTLRNSFRNQECSTFTLIDFRAKCWGNEFNKSSSSRPVDEKNLSCSLFGVLSCGEIKIETIDIDIITNAIDNKLIIDFNF